MPLKRTDQMAQRKAAAPPSRRYLVFAVGQMEYGVEIRRVRQSMRAASHQEAGIVIQGHAYPRVDARALFGMPASLATDRMILAMEAMTTRAALVVDTVVTLTSIEAHEILPLPAAFEGIEREWFEGVARIDARLIALVRLETLLSPRFQSTTSAPVLALAASR